MNEQEARIIVTAEDNASSTINKVGKSVDDMSDNVKKNAKSLSDWAKSNKQTFQDMRNYGTVAFVGIAYAMKNVVDEASNIQGSLVGLKSIAEGVGEDFGKSKKFLDEFTKDGLVPMANASTALKNLFARGFDLDQSIELLKRFKDSASFGRQASYSLGDAVTSATEGLKNENSILVDNAGVTKNVAKMREDYAKAHGLSVKNMTKGQKAMAEYEGILEETKFQVGDSTKYLDTYAGKQSQVAKSYLDMKVALGNVFMPIMSKFYEMLKPIIDKITERTIAHPELAKYIGMVALGLAGLVTVIGLIGLALPTIIAGFSFLGGVIGALVSPLGLVVIAIGLLYLAWKNNFLGLRDFTDSVLKELQEFWRQHGEQIIAGLTMFRNVVKALFKGAFDTIMGLWKIFSSLLKGDWQGVRQGIKDVFNAQINTIKTVFQALLPALSGIWEGIKSVIFSAINSVIDKINRMIDKINAITGASIGRLQTVGSQAQSTANRVNSAFSGSGSSSGSGGSGGGGGSRGGERANGGPVESGKTYLVGERGPEVFVPRQSGTIIPNGQSGGVNINFGGVSISKEVDLDKFKEKIQSIFRNDVRIAKLGVY